MATTYNLHIEELDANSPVAPHPPNTKIRLKRHQLTLLQRCLDFENERIALNTFSSMQSIVQSPQDHMRTHIGILGDKVGSGKSYVLLALMMCNTIPRNEPAIRTYGHNKIIIWQHENIRLIKTNLLVIPHNLVGQWEEYIKLFNPRLQYLMASKAKVVDQMFDTAATTDVSQYDLLVVTSTFYNKVAHLLNSKSIKLRRTIFDEVDNMNIPGCVQVESDFYWFVTASFGNLLYPRGFSRWDPLTRRHIQNAAGLKNSGFVKNLFTDLYSMVSNDYIRILVVKNRDTYIQESIDLPHIQNFYVRCRTPTTISVLNGIVDKNIIECLNAGDISSAIQALNPQNRKSEDSIVTLLIDRYTKQVRNIQVRMDSTRHYEYDSEAEKQAELDRLTRRSEELEQKINSIRNRIKDNDMCCICCDDLTNKTVVPCCSNSYCFRCISLWLCQGRNSCPICKSALSMNNVLVVDSRSAGETSAAGAAVQEELDRSAEIHGGNEKLKNLENILRKLSPASKVLLFSSYENSFTNIQAVLQQLNLSFASLKGNSNQIKSIIDQYKTGDLNVLLVNTRSYGSGLNLENTTDLILLHKFDNEIEKQVIGRAHRYGRLEPLRVWYLLHENELGDLRSEEGEILG